MSSNEGTRFTDDRSEYERARADGENITYTAALHLPNIVKPLCEELTSLASSANQVNVLNPFSSYRQLRAVRNRFSERTSRYLAQVQDCRSRLAEPVEGASPLELGWFQGFTFASGMAALMELNSSISSVSEALDRKSAYTMACFSLYIAVLSLVVSVVSIVFGWLSLK